MKTTWIVSDWHLHHENITKFLDKDGNRIRPYASIEEHDNTLIKNHNALVSPNDRVYMLGDAVINKKGLHKLQEFNGRKVLLMGNHDIFEASEYLKYFEDVRAYKVYPKQRIILSHIPLYFSSFERFNANVHGHLHQNVVLDSNGVPDKRYINVCVELTGMKPVTLDSIFEKVKEIKDGNASV